MSMARTTTTRRASARVKARAPAAQRVPMRRPPGSGPGGLVSGLRSIAGSAGNLSAPAPEAPPAAVALMPEPSRAPEAPSTSAERPAGSAPARAMSAAPETASIPEAIPGQASEVLRAAAVEPVPPAAERSPEMAASAVTTTGAEAAVTPEASMIKAPAAEAQAPEPTPSPDTAPQTEQDIGDVEGRGAESAETAPEPDHEGAVASSAAGGAGATAAEDTMAEAPDAEGEPPQAAPAPEAALQTEQGGAAAEGGEAAPEEPAPEPSPEQAVAPAAAAVGRRASGSASHQPAGAAAGTAVAAGNRPEVTQRRAAQQAGIQSADSAETGEVSTPTFEQALRDAIKQAMPEPRNESEARDVMQHGAERASAALGQTMGEQQTQAVGNLPAAVDEEAQPDPATMPGGEEVELVPEEVGEPPAGVSAAPVVPPPSTETAIDTSENRERVDTLAAESNITEEQLRRGNDPQFEATLGAREEAEVNDREAPARLREAEAADRQATRERGQGAIAAGLSAFHGARAEQLNAVAGQQTDTQGLTDLRKQEITADIEAIGASVRADVTEILDDMDTEVNDTFQIALDEAMGRYEAAFDDVKGGLGTAISDWWNDVSNEERLQKAFAAGRRVYDERISTAITEVARIVEEKLQKARDRVAEGRAEIDRYMTDEVSDAERDFAEQATTAITADFDALEGEINERRDAVVQRMVGMYREGIERRNAREEQLREENKSFWERVYDATVGVIEKVIQFKNMLLGILGRAADVVEAIIQDPIGFLTNLIAGIGAGLERFVANIAENLKQALMGWLFGALEGAGIRLPQTFDLKGFLDILLQVLGLTKENVRARAVRILGEEMVAKIEAAVDFLRVLFTEGPAAVWQMLLEKLGNLKDAIIEEIKSWVITKIIVAGVKWLVGLLNPASAFVKACMAIYDIVMFFMQRGQQIISAVNAIVNALGTIVAGNISAMAQAVEGALNRILPVVIGFLASLLSLGDISDKIRQFIEAVQEPVNKAIDWVISKGVSIAKKIAGLFGVGRDQSQEDADTLGEGPTGLHARAAAMLGDRLGPSATPEEAGQACTQVVNELRE
ncbi:MAG: hypothetical protein LJE61_14175, partial [Thiocapsa sp.]|nr:hypothetical protein [Thiocapsa sp.]